MTTSSREEVWKVTKLKPHPYAKKVLGTPSKQEVNELAADMKANGQRTAIDILADGTILDGSTRLLAAMEAGITELRVIVHEFDELAAKRFILNANLLRHHYDALVLARVYKELKALNQGEGGRASKTGDGDLRDRLAKRFNISGRTLDRHVKMLDTPAEAQQLYRKAVLSDSVMVALALLKPDQQKAVLAEIKAAKDAKQKNAAAKTAISKCRKENAEKRAAAKKADGKADGATRDAGGKAQNATPTASAADPGDAGGHDVDTPEEPVEEVADGDHAGQAEGDEEIVVTDAPGAARPIPSASATEQGAAPPAADDEDHGPVETYHWVLHELPDTFDTLVDQIDDIVGEAMDAEDAVVALRRIAESVDLLIEAEEAKAAALSAA